MEFTGERYVPSLDGQIKYEHLHRYALALKFVAGKSVLDLASGEGYGSTLLARVAQSVVGVDIDKNCIEYARKQYESYSNLNFIVGSCDSVPLPDQSFEVVTSFETIEHHNKHEQMMLEIKRVLRQGGVLIISSPDRLNYSDKPNYLNPYHIKELYYDELFSLLSRHFKYVQIYGQRLATGSFVFSLQDSNEISFNAYTGSGNHVTQKVCCLESPIYFVAICSDEAVSTQQAINSVYIDSSDDLLKALETGWYETRVVLKQLQSQLQETQAELDRLRLQLQEKQEVEVTLHTPIKLIPKGSVPKPIEYPLVKPIPEESCRPFWSVMIPTYNGTKYLEQTLKSVLEQDPGSNEMQIEVIDDCSTKDDPEGIVRKIGQDRVIFSRQPHNVGLIGNWDKCIQRARGHWVHILHQDDLVMPGFYSCLRQALEKEPTVGAAFCRHSYIDEKGDCLFLSLLERETPGILSDWLGLIATMQRVQFASIVVRRSTYEELGGFCPQARSAADWEMWKRIAAHFPVWYEPQILACFRLHSASESSRLIRTGTNIADTRRAIEISQSYLPNTIAGELSSKARDYYALDALNRASKMLDKHDLTCAIAQIREGLKCSDSPKVIRSLASLLLSSEPDQFLTSIPDGNEPYPKVEFELRDINLIIFPDWNQLEELLYQDLVSVIRSIVTHPERSRMALLIDNSDVSDEDANLIISGVIINMLQQEDIDITEEIGISLVGKLSDMQWKSLVQRFHARIVLKNENKRAITKVGAENIPCFELEELETQLGANYTRSMDAILAQLQSLPGDWHTGGVLSGDVLQAIVRYVGSRQLLYSVETGSGASTLLLSHISKDHKVFSYDCGSNGLTVVRSSALLNKATVEFVEGPTQRTLPPYTFGKKIQLALIDGPHGYPFPDLEYYFIYPHLEENALLIIDDIWIPTIYNLFNFIKEDEMFELIDIVGKTAFFRRNNALLLNPYADDWFLQNYNKKRFPIDVFQDLSLSQESNIAKKKALVFFPHNPYPPRTGAHQRCLAMLRGLKELGYDVTLFGSNLITDNPWPVAPINNLQDDLGVKVEVYQGTQADQQFMAQVSASTRELVNWDIYTPPGLRERFRQLFAQLAPDVAVINYALWGGLAIGEEFKSAVRIIDTHDLITLNIQKRQALGRYLTTVPFIPDQIDPSLVEEDFFSKLQLDAAPDEYCIYDQYDYTIAMSPFEAQAIRERTHRTRVEYVPMTFATEPFNNTYTGEPLFLVGPNPFNVQGYLYFTTKVLPVVLRQLPEFSLRVVGSTCQQLLPVDGIQLLGFVPDLKLLYSHSRFAVCPLIGGTGQQVKIVEAMAHGVPVIALGNVAESSPIQHGKNGFIANNAEEFAEYTIQLFREQELCRQLGQAARETISENFSNHALVEKLNFLAPEKLQKQNIRTEKLFTTIIVDGVFFQLYRTGIARVWRSLLEEWADNGFAKHIMVLDRAGTAPKIPGIRYRPVPPYDYGKTDADREMLQQVCDEEGADLFISSYYTTPISTPSVFLAHDMIPELMGRDLNHPMWREKHYGIQHAAAYITVSENTARDLVKVFPDISLGSVTVAKNGVDHKTFSPASPENINCFKTKYGIFKHYFILVGGGIGYKNSILFFKAFSNFYSRHGFEIVCTGSGSLLETEFRSYTSGSVVHMLQLSDEELRVAYSGAVALVYPSKYEGFGLPVLEAIACGCPVITCPNASIPEVAGEAALYVNDEDVDGLTDALCDVQKPKVRNSLIAAGLAQAKNFSWSKMAITVSSALIDATLLPLKLKDINLIVFPDWSQPEESLCLDLQRVIEAIATHPDSSQLTLLVDSGNISDEEAALILSSVTMNLLLQEDLDVTEGLEISLVGKLGEIQWEALLPRIQARIVLENENQQAITQLKAETIPSCELDSFSNKQAAQLKPGIWALTRPSEIAYFNSGMTLREQGKLAEAMSSYQKALEIRPDFPEARYQLSLTRYENQLILKGYQFTQDWFSWNVPIWEQHLKRFINLPTLNVLEIGSWEGRSTCWLLDNIMTHEHNTITCIDTFEGSVEHRYDHSYLQSLEGRFDFNIVRTGAPEKVNKIVGNSHEVIRSLPLNSYDIVYIDGSHIASDVLQDAVLVWQVVKVGGFIIFDDYPFTFPENTAWNTKIGIDAFMMSFSDKFRVIHKAYQVILEKT